MSSSNQLLDSIRHVPSVQILVSQIKLDENNPNIMTEEKMEALEKIMKDPEVGNAVDVWVNDNGDGTYLCIDGEHRIKVLLKNKIKYVWAKVFKVSYTKVRILRQIANKLRGEHDKIKDALEFKAIFEDNQLEEFSKFLSEPLEDFEKILEEQFSLEIENKEESENLIERFGAPPFSILDAKQGYWQNRKKYWISLGIKSELGRDATTYDIQHMVNSQNYRQGPITDQSIFDPVLTEIMIKWFSSSKDNILDPFAGGSVRGIVSGLLNRTYFGIDMSEKQNNENRNQCNKIFKKIKTKKIKPQWSTGKSQSLSKIYPGKKFDFILTCPPYHDLEKYSDDEDDLSNMTYSKFRESYDRIIKASCNQLNDNRFACIVISDIRDKQGFYENLTLDTIASFEKNKIKLYNHFILATNLTTAPVRASSIFPKSRKAVKVHQNVLVFFKGDSKNIKPINEFTSFKDKGN